MHLCVKVGVCVCVCVRLSVHSPGTEELPSGKAPHLLILWWSCSVCVCVWGMQHLGGPLKSLDLPWSDCAEACVRMSLQTRLCATSSNKLCELWETETVHLLPALTTPTMQLSVRMRCSIVEADVHTYCCINFWAILGLVCSTEKLQVHWWTLSWQTLQQSEVDWLLDWDWITVEIHLFDYT